MLALLAEGGARGGEGRGGGRGGVVVVVEEGFPLVVKPLDCDDLLGSETRDGNVSRSASVTSGRRAQVSAQGLSGVCVDRVPAWILGVHTLAGQ